MTRSKASVAAYVQPHSTPYPHHHVMLTHATRRYCCKVRPSASNRPPPKDAAHNSVPSNATQGPRSTTKKYTCVHALKGIGRRPEMQGPAKQRNTCCASYCRPILTQRNHNNGVCTCSCRVTRDASQCNSPIAAAGTAGAPRHAATTTIRRSNAGYDTPYSAASNAWLDKQLYRQLDCTVHVTSTGDCAGHCIEQRRGCS